MNIQEVQDLIVNRFDAAWFDTSLEHVNTVIDKLDIEEWARLSIVHGQSKAISFAMTAKRNGHVNVQIFTKIDIGQGRAVSLAKKAGDILTSLSTGSLVFYPYDINIVGNKASDSLTTTEISWFQVNCIVDFTYID